MIGPKCNPNNLRNRVNEYQAKLTFRSKVNALNFLLFLLEVFPRVGASYQSGRSGNRGLPRLVYELIDSLSNPFPPTALRRRQA